MSKGHSIQFWSDKFDESDTDKNGFMSYMEFKAFIQKYSSMTDEQITYFFCGFDRGKADAKLTKKEFTDGMEGVAEYLRKATALFKKYDASGDGYLSKDELKKLLTELMAQSGSKGKLSDQAVNDILATADTNGDDHISLTEFLNACA